MQHCTWLGFRPRAASGGSRARVETPGRVGEPRRKTGLFSLPSGKSSSEPTPTNVQHCTWLGFRPRAASGGSRARAETPGRVGELTRMTGLFFFAIWQVFFRANPPNVQHCTWLGFRPRARSAGRRVRAETPGRVGEPSFYRGDFFCTINRTILLTDYVPSGRLLLIWGPVLRRSHRFHLHPQATRGCSEHRTLVQA